MLAGKERLTPQLPAYADTAFSKLNPVTFPSISARTRTLAIIGDPIRHSLTPRIQNAAWRAAGADVVNVAFRVPSTSLEAAVRGAQALEILGLMVTIPHKEAVIGLCDELHESAQLLGAANLLHFREDGHIVGHSSDGWGALQVLAEAGIDLEGARVALLGGGGSARSLALTFANAGAKEVRLFNRTPERAAIIAREVEAKVGVRAQAFGLDELAHQLEGVELLVNTTSVGMHPNADATPLPAEWLPPDLMVYDIVYNPLETRLLREARAKGARGIDGLGMLIYTNVYAAQTCAGIEISAQVMREEAVRAFAERGAR